MSAAKTLAVCENGTPVVGHGSATASIVRTTDRLTAPCKGATAFLHGTGCLITPTDPRTRQAPEARDVRH